ncbi:hypothetical protein [Saccharibacillus alkalitolerans]|uniref:DUF5643 domain-containing protein n=1 Tax=Saccharibacillus alkalitolerans TaxID=2705290 RepID=A0ABX0FDR0_9BACL|nr:hypothetical protein [Saccharibacillus alkalitolerans]NGZ78018.1 hypothetical protein [Saccharibacillus alkalitolerans]
MTGKDKKVYAILTAILLAVAASWGLNGVYFNRGQLEKPVFLQHRIEAENGAGSSFILYRLQNRTDERRVEAIELPGIEVRGTTRIRHIEYRQQTLDGYMLEIADTESPAAKVSDEQPIVVRKADVRYDDGSRETADIGEVRFYPPSAAPSDLLYAIGGGSSNRNTGHATLEAGAPVKILSLQSPYLEEAAGKLSLFWADSGTAYEPFDMEQPAGDNPLANLTLPKQVGKKHKTSLGYRFVDRDSRDWSTVYRLLPVMTVQSGERTLDLRPASIEDNPSPSESQIRQFVRSGREKS